MKLRAKLPSAEIVARHEAGESIRSLASAFGVVPRTIRRHISRADGEVRGRSDAVVAENKKRPRGRGSRGGRTKAVEYVYELRRRKYAIVREYRNSRGCQRCGESHPGILDLHHPDPSTKHPRLSKQKENGRWHSGGSRWADLSYVDLQAELAKCEVLCSNCHRKETWEARKAEAEALIATAIEIAPSLAAVQLPLDWDDPNQ